MSIPLSEQLKEVNREVAVRTRVYPRWVAEGKGGLTQESATEKLETMKAVAETLRELIRKSEELPL